MYRALFAVTLLALPLMDCAPIQSASTDIVPFPGSEAIASARTDATAIGYTIETPVEIIAADAAGVAVINRDIPGLLADSHYVFFKGMSLKTIAALSGGQLTSTTLNQTAADLASLHKIASLAQ
jgi:hypothetical protein